MRKAALAIALAVAGATLAGMTLAGATLAQMTGEVTVVGFVTDTFCGRRGASEKHAEHARRTVASGLAQYALYDEATKQLYILEPQATAEQYVGHRVKITGTLGTTPLRRAGQSYAPDAVAAYRDPSAPNGLRSTASHDRGATSTPASSGAAKVQSHENALDQTTPIAGVLSISSVEPAPTPPPRRNTGSQ